MSSLIQAYPHAQISTSNGTNLRYTNSYTERAFRNTLTSKVLLSQSHAGIMCLLGQHLFLDIFPDLSNSNNYKHCHITAHYNQ